MEIRNKKINFLGDSITEGVGVSSPEFKYVEVFAKKFEPAVVRNYGIGGTRFAKQINPTVNNPRFDLDFCSRVAEMDEDADIVVVFGGTNDYGHGDAPFGTFDDRTPRYVLRRVSHAYDESYRALSRGRHSIMTPLHRMTETRKNREPLSSFVRAIKEVAEFYSIPVLDLYATAGIQPQLEIHRTKFAPDGLHPNNAGAEKIADRLGAFLRSL